MNQREICPHCGTALPTRSRFCSSCGNQLTASPATPFERFCAAAIDISIWLALSIILVLIGLKWWVSPVVWIALIELGYQLNGGIGKSLLGLFIPVRNRSQFYLRETIAKLASAAMFGIGFLMILSKEHQALHDYIAKTSVLRIGQLQRVRLAVITLAIALGAAVGGYDLTRSHTQPHLLTSNPERSASMDAITSRIPAVATLYTYNIKGKSLGQGSGFLISSDGIGVTNFHVLRGAYSANAKLGDGRLYNVLAIQAYDPDRDIAIFRLGREASMATETPQDLPFLKLAADQVQVGDHIATIGSPEGLTSTVSDGLVSAIRINDGSRVFQISAPVSPGSSGGPVLNLKGEVVAISTFQLVEGQNLNFAIPADEIETVQAHKADLSLQELYWEGHTSARMPIPPSADNIGRIGAKAQSETSLTGTYTGTANNLTANLQARLGIVVKEDQGSIRGCMVVMKPLYGSGPLVGSVSGTLVSFDVFWIHFEGSRTANHISGTYRVASPDGSYQNGEFALDRIDAKGLSKGFDAQRDCPTDADVNR